MKINFKDINKVAETDLNIDLKKINEEYSSETIKKFNSLKGNLKLQKVDHILIFDIKFDANLTLISSYSLKEFDKDINIKETLYFTDDEEFLSDDVIFVDNEIDVTNIVFTLALTSLPINLHAPKEEKIEGEGYRVIKEEDLENEDEVKESPFDILKDIEL